MSNAWSLAVSVTALSVSITVAYLTIRERYRCLRCKLLGREEFHVTSIEIEAVLLVFNSSSRSNCIEYIGVYVNDEYVLSDFMNKSASQKGVKADPVPFNKVPSNIGAGSGETIRVLGFQWASADRPRNCVLTVAVTDVFGRVVKVHKPFTNKWSRMATV